MTKGLIFNIQRYSIHDGPGIRTTVFFKGCPLRCSWCQNPESKARKPEIFLDKNKCGACGRCVVICPTEAARILKETSTVERSSCIGCGKCAEVCPIGARRLVGRYISVDEVMSQVLRDMKFYENSGGGITLSGGEPTAQPHFALSILEKCKEVGIHTTLDTCGYVSWPIMEKLLNHTDLVLYDIKHLDPRKHYEATGKDNRLILRNVVRIARFKPIRVRVPVIPRFNNSLEEVRGIARFAKKELGSADIDLLPYNKMGERKYELLEKGYCPLQSNDDRHIQAMESIVSFEAGLSHQNVA